jgi:subtilisin family serine protease
MAVVLTSVSPASAQAPPDPAGAPNSSPGTILGARTADTVPNRFIVVLKDDKVQAADVSSASRNLAKKYGGQARRTYSSALRGFTATMTEAQATALAADPAVALVERDQVVRADGTQVSPVWNLDRIDQRAFPLNARYAYPTTAATVRAYVIDTGIRTTHAQFGGRALNGWDFIDDDAIAQDCDGHGTHVAGTIAGSTYGVAKGAKVVGVRVLDCEGSGYTSGVIAGIDWVTAHAIRPAVANMSLGGAASAIMDLAVNRSIAHGIPYVVAAGNENVNACTRSPARVPMAITVGASENTSGTSDTRAGFSNYGSCLDLFAPGVAIRSSINTTNTAWASYNGTSMASPHVAGAAALILAAHPGYTPRQVTDSIVVGSTKGIVKDPRIGSPNRLLYTGSYSYVPSPTCAVKSSATAVAIPDPGYATSGISVSCAGKASSTSTVRVQITHPRPSEVMINITSPSGKVYLLKPYDSVPGVQNIDAIYRVGLGAENRTGAWRLKVTDRYALDRGTLRAWSLSL